MKSGSAWYDTKLPEFPGLAARPAKGFDIVVIGGGITGLTAAYLLAQAGKRVCLLERGRLASVDTGQTTAHLTYVTDIRLSALVRNFGRDAARLVWQGGNVALNAIEKTAATLKIDCALHRIPGFLHAPWKGAKDEADDLADEAQLARELGFEATFVRTVPVFGMPGVRFANQARFHPRKYAAGLAQALVEKGGSIFEESEVSAVESRPMGVVCNGVKLPCDYVIVATHNPLAGTLGFVSATLLQSRLALYSSYVVAGRVPKGKLPEASFWDTASPYSYLRVDAHSNFDYAIYGGEDHKTGQVEDTEAPSARLADRLRQLAPRATLDRRWSGQVIETNDGLPCIGETAEGQFVATGFGGNGMTFGTLSGMMACDAALGRENPWRDIFSVGRVKVRSGAWRYLVENLDYPYYYIKDRLTSAASAGTRSVRREEGKVVDLEGQRVACYRDKEGQLTLRSAVCPHMGCIVHWNAAEQTWDCPCHGSRFQATGEVLSGPAEAPLAEVEQPAKARREPVRVPVKRRRIASVNRRTSARRRAPNRGKSRR